MTGDSDYIINGLISRGMPEHAALAYVGNSSVETDGTFSGSINEYQPVVPGSRGGLGLLMWTGPRRRQLEAFAGSQGLDPHDVDTQMDFLIWETQNTEQSAHNQVLAASNAEDAARIVSEQFLRPGIPHLDRRISETQRLAQNFQPSGAVSEGRDYSALHDAYDSGRMSDAQRQFYEAKVQDGTIPSRSSTPDPLSAPRQMDVGLLNAYRSGAMTADQRAVIDRALESGRMLYPSEDVMDEVSLIPAGYDLPPNPNERTRPKRTNRNDLSEDSFSVASAAWDSVTGQGPSLTAPALSEGMPLGFGDIQVALPESVAEVVGRVVDAPLGLLSAGTGAYQFGVGALADGADALGVPRADALGRDLAALPEAFTGSPTSLLRPRSSRPSGRVMDAEVIEEIDPNKVGRDIRAAANNPRNQQNLANAMDLNIDAVQAADRLNIDLPPDVFSDNTLIKEAVGMSRSVAGTPVSAGWRDTVLAASDRAQEAIEQIGGGRDLSSVSSDVLASLRGSQTALKTQADSIYSRVDSAIPPSTQVVPDRLIGLLNETKSNMGGRLTDPELSLYDIVTNNAQLFTYERLRRIKAEIGAAIGRQDSPYSTLEGRTLSRLYAALSEDQIATVRAVGGDEMADNLVLANNLTAQRKSLEEQIVSAFGKDFEGSIGNRLRSAISSGARGDAANLNRMLNVIPEDLRVRAVASAINAQSLGQVNGQRVFGFAQYARLYDDLRSQSEVYGVVVDTLGEDAAKVMRDLYDVSQRITEARGNVHSTGKGNQALLGGITAESLVSQVMSSSVARTTTRGVGAAGGSMVAGPAGAGSGAVMAETLIRALSSDGKDRLVDAGKMFASPEFQRVAIEAATRKQVSQAAINGATNSRAYRDWARSVGLPNPEQWLGLALTAQAGGQDDSE